jgi:hypothetical protein
MAKWGYFILPVRWQATTGDTSHWLWITTIYRAPESAAANQNVEKKIYTRLMTTCVDRCILYPENMTGGTHDLKNRIDQ